MVAVMVVMAVMLVVVMAKAKAVMAAGVSTWHLCARPLLCGSSRK